MRNENIHSFVEQSRLKVQKLRNTTWNIDMRKKDTLKDGRRETKRSAIKKIKRTNQLRELPFMLIRMKHKLFIIIRPPDIP